MDIRKLQRAIVDGLEDVKAHDIVVFNTEHLSPLFERVIIASGTSNRQTRALASSVRQAVKAQGLPVLATEGSENGEWIIVDCGAAVAHIMQPDIRSYYHLEEIWGGKAVRMKVGAEAGKGLVKASDDDADEAATPRVAAPKRSAGRAAPGGKATGAGQRAPARPTARTEPAARPASTRRVPATGKPTAAGKAPARRTAAGKAAAGKTAASKPAAGRGRADKGSASTGQAGKAAGSKVPARKSVATRSPAAPKSAARKTPQRRG